MVDPTQFVSYELVKPGWEGVYTGEKAEAPGNSTDPEGNMIQWWSTWAFTDEGADWGHSDGWDDEILYINGMQEKLGPLDDDTRKIRAHIGSFVPCDSGSPVTVDELLQAIGRGSLPTPSFRNGCWHCAMSWEAKTSQTGQQQSMRDISTILTGYLNGESKADLSDGFAHARGFICRLHDWLGPVDELTDSQRLLMKRMLLPFELWARTSFWDLRLPDERIEDFLQEVDGKSGRGAQIDAELAALGETPPSGIPHKHAICECHHNTFRYIEKWLYRIGTGQGDIPSRRKGTERARIGQLNFGYSLALDRWLLGVPMQFLLLDLGHVDLGFDPKNEVLRTYAYLGEDRTPLKEWLAASLWYSITYNPIFIDPDYRIALGPAQQSLIDRATEVGISLRDWADSALGKRPDYR